MIELRDNALVVSFPEVHKHATMRIDFQRTLRLPDDGRIYPLPAGLGRFPLRHVDDYAGRVPPQWIDHGGVLLPMYQAEALWINFSSSGYPFAVRVGTGKIDAATGDPWRDDMGRDPQNYLVIPSQPWLDGYCVEKGVIRQFVAMPLGAGYTAEEQLTGKSDVGGIQIVAYPMKREGYERHAADWERGQYLTAAALTATGSAMGLAPGGRMRQEIYRDRYQFDEWDRQRRARCFVHIANSVTWRAITCEQPPTTPVTAEWYQKFGVPWFDFYAEDETPVQGSALLRKLKSVFELGKEKREAPLPDNAPVEVGKVVDLRRGLRKEQVREGRF
jgi:hypothetical protein